MSDDRFSELLRRYENDARFHAVVEIIAREHGSGYRDDDGVWHAGPTIGDAELAHRIFAFVEDGAA